jgi:hypothetical protein
MPRQTAQYDTMAMVSPRTPHGAERPSPEVSGQPEGTEQVPTYDRTLRTSVSRSTPGPDPLRQGFTCQQIDGRYV